MNDETLNDLKQFITTTVHQEIFGVSQDITGIHKEISGIHQEITSLETKINERFDENNTMQNEILNAIGETQELHAKAIRHQANTIDNHERRILKLEKRTA